MYTFHDKVALVTGAVGVIGKAYAKYLLQNNIKGIAHVCRREPDDSYKKELETKHDQGKNIFIQADVTNKIDLKDAFEATVKHFGQLDIVINNAGICNEEDYELTMQTNFMGVLHGTMLAMREFLPKYKIDPGLIINTSSISAVISPRFLPVYSLSKHAITAIGLNYARNDVCIENDIRVLTICPGSIASKLLRKAQESYPDALPAEPSISKTADFLGKGMIKMVKEGVNGAVWLFWEGKEPHIVDYTQLHQSTIDYIMG